MAACKSGCSSLETIEVIVFKNDSLIDYVTWHKFEMVSKSVASDRPGCDNA